MSDLLSIESLADSGGFATGQPVEQTITWQQGETEHDATVYVKQLSYHTAVADIRSTSDGDDESIAIRIANTICDADGSPIFSVADIVGTADENRGPLHGNLTIALLQAIGEVNNPKATSSTQNQNSGPS